MIKKDKITVVGAGYVGMSLSVLLAKYNEVMVLDIDKNRVNQINKKQSTVLDEGIDLFLNEKSLFLKATIEKKEAYEAANFIIVATPTDYDTKTNCFDTTSVDSVVGEALNLNQHALVVIKSTIPVGHTKSLQKKFKTKRIVFSPEFLREGQALKDNLFPSRIIVGNECGSSERFAGLLSQAAEKPDIEIIFTSSSEAEAIKLFSNTYLAMRVSFFNELDSFALENALDTKNIIRGVCLDERIGDGYCNPSFGYGGYCLPKDTKQLLTSYDAIPQALIQAIVSSNSTRKDFIVKKILERNPKVIGIYRLVMKQGSDNYRFSAVQSIIRRLKHKGLTVLIYEPSLKVDKFFGSKILNDLETFKYRSDLIVANRKSKFLSDVENKLFSRDLFGYT